MSRKNESRAMRSVIQRNIEMADRPNRDREGSHSQGWPHYNRKGNCICMNKCCFGSGGCVCKGYCAGHGHANCDRGHICSTSAVIADACTSSGIRPGSAVIAEAS